MRPPRAARVAEVRPGSPADQAGIAPGDRLVQMNGRAPRDYIDYRYLAAEAEVRLLVVRPDGRRRRLVIGKGVDEDLGIRFTSDVFDGVHTCRNCCSFCFLAQLPKGLRPALYMRDDDYRLSYLHGNFVTLTNLTPADQARIVRLHLSPLYVSVHATEPQVRARLFGRAAEEALGNLGRLIARGIEFHTQIVVCPGVNDGQHLEQTIGDLAALHPGVRSIGVVPVGLTRHRRGLTPIRRVRSAAAAEIVSQVEAWQHRLRRQLGTRLVFAADELYLLAGRAVPGRAYYEDFWQLENGIGGARLFLDDLRRMRPPRPRRPLAVTLATGEAAAGMVKLLAQGLAAERNVKVEVCVVRNRLLGRSVTSAGLLAGQDIARALERSGVGDLAIVPAAALREGEGFLDSMTLDEVSRRVGTHMAAAGSPRQAAAVIRAFDHRRSRR